MNKKRETSNIILLILFVLCLALGAGIYYFQIFTFQMLKQEIASSDAVSTYKAKSKKLKPLNAAVVDTEDFIDLRKGYWHEYDKTEFVVGNNSPFK